MFCSQNLKVGVEYGDCKQVLRLRRSYFHSFSSGFLLFTREPSLKIHPQQILLGMYPSKQCLPILGGRAEISVPHSLRSSSDTDEAHTGGELYFGVGVYIGVVLCEEQRKFFRRNIRDTIIAAIISRHPINPSIPATTVFTDTPDTRGNDILTNEVPS